MNWLTKKEWCPYLAGAMSGVVILIGSLPASRISGTFEWKGLPDMWASRFGSSWIKRGVLAFIGGLIAIFGARLADGTLKALSQFPNILVCTTPFGLEDNVNIVQTK